MLGKTVSILIIIINMALAGNVSITGIVKNRASDTPVSGAVVFLRSHGRIADTTGGDGRFSLSGSVPLALPSSSARHVASRIVIKPDAIVFTAQTPGIVTVAIWDVSGRQVSVRNHEAAGPLRIITPYLADGVYMGRIETASGAYRFSFVSVNRQFAAALQYDEVASAVRAPAAASLSSASVDTLVVQAVGFARTEIPMPGFTLDTVVLLDAVTGKPNVILVVLDDVGYGNFGCTGDATVKTPHIDGFYSEAVRLTDFHMSPTCSPSRAALLTGRYNISTGVWSTILQRDMLRLDEWTMADALRSGGYATGMFGKWHLGDGAGYTPHHRGFDLSVIHGFGGITQMGDYWGNGYTNDTYFVNGEPKKFSGYCTAVWFREAMSFIEDNRENPFFVYLSTNIAHSPLNPPPGYLKYYSGKVPDARARHYAMISHLDDQFDSLRTFLKKNDLEDNTIMIFSSDNGMSNNIGAYNAKMRGLKGSHYEGGHRVPFFVRWPEGGIAGGRDIHDLAAHIDVMPTLLDLCGVSARGHTFHGASLAPLLQGKAVKLPDRIVVVDHQMQKDLVKHKSFSVMKEKWRLVGSGEQRELYDLSTDPGQAANVIGDNTAMAAELDAAYEDWWALVAKRADEESPFPIGERPTEMHAGDFRQSTSGYFFLQSHVKNGNNVKGYWEVMIEKDGKYRFELRRWPRETNGAIRGSVSGGKSLKISKATLKIQGQTLTKSVGAGDKAATFDIDLKAGNAHLEAIFSGGVTVSAYYVYAGPSP